jgi:hypothetical protein
LGDHGIPGFALAIEVSWSALRKRAVRTSSKALVAPGVVGGQVQVHLLHPDDSGLTGATSLNPASQQGTQRIIILFIFIYNIYNIYKIYI